MQKSEPRAHQRRPRHQVSQSSPDESSDGPVLGLLQYKVLQGLAEKVVGLRSFETGLRGFGRRVGERVQFIKTDPGLNGLGSIKDGLILWENDATRLRVIFYSLLLLEHHYYYFLGEGGRRH